MAAAVAFTPTSSTPIDESGFTPSSTTPIDETMNTRGQAELGAGEAALSQATGALASIPAGVSFLGRSALHGIEAGIGYGAANTPGSSVSNADVTGWLARKNEEDQQNFRDIQNFWTYAPRSEAGKATNEAIARGVGQLTRPTRDVLSDVGVPKSITSRIPEPGPGTQAAVDVGGQLLMGASALPAAGIPRALAGGVEAARGIARPAEAAAAPARVPPTKPLTGDDLRAAPNPIPKPGEPEPAATAPTPVPVPGKPHIRPKVATATEPTAAPVAAATEPPARTFAPPSEEGPQPTPTPEQQGARQQTLENLNGLSGGTLQRARQSAVTGDYDATGDDFQQAKVGNKAAQAQIANENDSLHAAADNLHDSLGSSARNSVDTETLEQRAGVVRSAFQGMKNWFDGATNGLYESARRTVGNNAIPELGRVKNILGDDSNFATTDAIALQKAAQSRLQRLWTTGDPAGNVGAGSVTAAERFREFLNEQWTPGTSRLIGKLKDATDLDVAEHGGLNAFSAARAMRAHQARMLEDNPVISKMLDRDSPTPDRELMDKISNAPREHFADLANVLRASAHLGNGELAESAAAALREIKAHMTSRMHNAARNADGTWNARNFYTQANQYSTKAPAVFSPAEIGHLKTLNDAGNVLRMDKSYPGAVAQAARTGIAGHALQLAGNMTASLAHEIPVIGRFVGRKIEDVTERVIGGQTAEKAERKFQARTAPLGQAMGQRGAVGNLAQREAIEHVQRDDANGTVIHRYTVPNKGGSMNVIEYPGRGVRQVQTSVVSQGMRGQGWGTRMLQRAADDAHANGQILHSDGRVSGNVSGGEGLAGGQVNAYKNLARLGYKVKLMDHDNVGGEYRSVGDHVFEVGPRQASAYEQSGNLNALSPKLAARPGFKPYYQKGSVPVAPATLNIGLHQGTEGQPGFRVMSKQEAVRALTSQGLKVGKTTVSTAGSEPTLVADVHRPLTEPEMQSVLAKTKQSAIPQRLAGGDGTMSVAPGHEQTAREQGWDQYNPDFFRMHDNRTATEHATDFNPEQLEGPHPNATVKNAVRSPYPGIYDSPKEILSRLSVAKEDPILKELFGVTRKDLHDTAMSREGNLPGTLPGAAAKPKGSKAAESVMTKENEDRLVSLLKEAKKNPDLAHGMVGWYVMDPLHARAVQLLGKKAGTAAYARLNNLMGMASPGSDVMTEINRGTAANMMAAQGKFPQFLQHAGKPAGARGSASFPPELANVQGHPYHRTAQGLPMSKYLESGELQMKSPKVPMYIQASGVPETGFQTRTPVGDSHWSRGVGLSDVRTNATPGSSVSNPEMSALAPWYREKVAKRAGLPAVSAQALQWGALGGETGVSTAVGAPKLELFAQQVKVAADRAGVKPKVMLDRIIKGIAHAG